MPFKSKAQQRFMFAAEERGEIPEGTAERWAHHTKSIKSLPEHVSKKKDHKKKSCEMPAIVKVALGLKDAHYPGCRGYKPKKKRTKSSWAELGELAAHSKEAMETPGGLEKFLSKYRRGGSSQKPYQMREKKPGEGECCD